MLKNRKPCFLHSMRIRLKIIASLSILFTTICKGEEVKIFFAIKPSDCISCMTPIKDILAEIEEQQLLGYVTMVVKDIPEKALSRYSKEVLKIPDSIKMVSSEELFSKYSFNNASAITIIDNSTTPLQRVTIPLVSYFANKTLFVERLSKTSDAIITIDRVKLEESMSGIRMLSIANDSVLVINDKVFNTISFFSIESGKILGSLKLDSAWYTAPYSKDTLKLRQIWENQHVLEKVSYPQYHLKGVFCHNRNNIISATSYYPFNEDKDFFILPKNLFFTLDTILRPVSCHWLYIDRANPLVNFNNAVFFDKEHFVTTAFDVVNNQLTFNPEFIYYFKSEGDSLVFEKSAQVEPPGFIKAGYPMNGFLLNYISEYMGNKAIWFSYYPEFYDLNMDKWVSIDSCYIDPKMTTNTFMQDQPIDFQVLGIWNEGNQYSMILRLGLQVFYAVQTEKNVTQSTQIYTLKEGCQLYMARKGENDFIGIEYDPKMGDSVIIRFTINRVQTFIPPFVN